VCDAARSASRSAGAAARACSCCLPPQAAAPRLTELTRTTAACVIANASPSPRKPSPGLGGRREGSDSTIGVDSDADADPCDDAPTSLDEVQQDLERNAKARYRRTNSGHTLTESVHGGLPEAVLPRSNSLEKLNALVDDPKHFDELLKDASVTTKHFESEIERELEDMMGEATLAKNALAADSGSQQAEILKNQCPSVRCMQSHHNADFLRIKKVVDAPQRVAALSYRHS
jgi:hypothetical protein